jgi:hypothetical protein
MRVSGQRSWHGWNGVLSFTASIGRHSRQSSSKHYVQRVLITSNMVVDEQLTSGVQAHTNSGKGKAPADTQVRAPSDLRPFCTPTTFYRPSDPVRIHMLYQQHFENIAQEEPFAWDCTMPDCVNRVRTHMVRVGPSNLLRGESGLFARETIIAGTVVLMMMPFYCSYRNKNEPSAIYPSFGYKLVK